MSARPADAPRPGAGAEEIRDAGGGPARSAASTSRACRSPTPTTGRGGRHRRRARRPAARPRGRGRRARTEPLDSLARRLPTTRRRCSTPTRRPGRSGRSLGRPRRRRARLDVGSAMYAALSVFPGSFDASAAAAGRRRRGRRPWRTPPPGRRLPRPAEPGGRRYRLLQPVRAHAAARLGPGGARAVHERLVSWCTTLAAELEVAARRADQVGGGRALHRRAANRALGVAAPARRGRHRPGRRAVRAPRALLGRLAGQPRGAGVGRRAARARRPPRARAAGPARGGHGPRPVRVRADRGEARPRREGAAPGRGGGRPLRGGRPPRSRSPSASAGATPTSTGRPPSSTPPGPGCSDIDEPHWAAMVLEIQGLLALRRLDVPGGIATLEQAAAEHRRHGRPTDVARAPVHRLRAGGRRLWGPARLRRGGPRPRGRGSARGCGPPWGRPTRRWPSATWPGRPTGSAPPTTGRSRSATGASSAPRSPVAGHVAARAEGDDGALRALLLATAEAAARGGDPSGAVSAGCSARCCSPQGAIDEAAVLLGAADLGRTRSASASTSGSPVHDLEPALPALGPGRTLASATAWSERLGAERVVRPRLGTARHRPAGPVVRSSAGTPSAPIRPVPRAGPRQAPAGVGGPW